MEITFSAKKASDEAVAKKDNKFETPDELPALLTQADAKVKNDALEANAQKMKAEETFSERQKWITQTFDLGRSFYQEGKYDQAVDEWAKLSPYFENQPEVRKLIESVKQSHSDAMAAK